RKVGEAAGRLTRRAGQGGDVDPGHPAVVVAPVEVGAGDEQRAGPLRVAGRVGEEHPAGEVELPRGHGAVRLRRLAGQRRGGERRQQQRPGGAGGVHGSAWILEKSATWLNSEPISVRNRIRFSRRSLSSAITITLSKKESTAGLSPVISFSAPE